MVGLPHDAPIEPWFFFSPTRFSVLCVVPVCQSSFGILTLVVVFHILVFDRDGRDMAGATVVFLAPDDSLYQGFFALLIVFAESLRSILYVNNIASSKCSFVCADDKNVDRPHQCRAPLCSASDPG
jgi:hypothetical protein